MGKKFNKEEALKKKAEIEFRLHSESIKKESLEVKNER